MKKKFILIIPLLLIIIGVSYYFIYINYDMYEVPKDVSITLNDNNFNIYEKHNSYELYNITNGKPINNEILINSELGEYTYTLEYTYKKRNYKYDIKYTISDKTPPVFISAPSILKMEANDKDDICKKLVYADNYDNNPKCMINGNYDKYKIGTYNDLEYVISDSSDNETKKAFTLEIVNKIYKSNNNTTKKYLYIDDIINKYKTDSTSIGIDISKWQGNVDFNKVKEAGVEFVIMRIGRQSSPDEDIVMDVKFKEYYKAVKELGIPLGIYIYNTATSVEDAKKVARWVIKELDGEKLDFPVAYDWEDWEHFMNYHISLHTLSETYKAFQKELNDNGYDAMLYSSKFYLENAWMDYNDTKIWLAHYTDKTDYQGKYMMWQMTSLAKINGITDNTVDIDILYK